MYKRQIQNVAENTGTEITAAEMWTQFEAEYLTDGGIDLRTYELHTTDTGAQITAQVETPDGPATITGKGNGPVSAFVHGLSAHLGIEVDVLDYSEHAIGTGADTQAVAYVEMQTTAGHVHWGVGVHDSIVAASLRAVLSGVNRIS